MRKKGGGEGKKTLPGFDLPAVTDLLDSLSHGTLSSPRNGERGKEGRKGGRK